MFRTRIRSSHGGLTLLLAAVALSNGCAALSNPTAISVPVRMLPKEVLARPRSEMVDVPFNLLQLKEEPIYRLDKGDVLAIIAGDLFGPEGQTPVSVPNPIEGTLAATGFPVPVQDEGTISLPNPKIPPIYVKGKSAAEVEQELRLILTGQHPDKEKYQDSALFAEGGAKISVQLLRKRRVRVQVIRQDTQGIPINNAGVFQTQQQRLGVTVPLEAGRNDVLNALNLTGGPPGVDGKNEVYIYRGKYDEKNPAAGRQRIPLKIFPDQQLTISQQDITLNEGDILFIPGREAEVFYTAGILVSRQLILPRDYDLDVIEAIAVANGPLVSGGFTQNAFVAQAFATGLGTPSPSLVTVRRLLDDGRQIDIRVDVERALKDPRERIYIKAGDMIIMQEKPYEAVGRYISQTLRFNFLQQIYRTSTGSATTNATGP